MVVFYTIKNQISVLKVGCISHIGSPNKALCCPIPGLSSTFDNIITVITVIVIDVLPVIVILVLTLEQDILECCIIIDLITNFSIFLSFFRASNHVLLSSKTVL